MRALLPLAVVATLAACSSAAGAGPTASQQSGAPGTTPLPVPTAPIVGRWERITTCEERVSALEAAGLGQFAAEHAASEGWIPGVTSADQLDDPGRPCQGAVPLKHGHFFTSEGQFGSTDDQGDQVDDGTYRMVDENTIVIEKEFGDVEFHFRIQDDGSLLLDPVMPECVKDGCFAAQWAVAVAYPGLPWAPVP